VADALSARIVTMTAGALSEVQDEHAMGELVQVLEARARRWVSGTNSVANSVAGRPRKPKGLAP